MREDLETRAESWAALRTNAAPSDGAAVPALSTSSTPPPLLQRMATTTRTGCSLEEAQRALGQEEKFLHRDRLFHPLQLPVSLSTPQGHQETVMRTRWSGFRQQRYGGDGAMVAATAVAAGLTPPPPLPFCLTASLSDGLTVSSSRRHEDTAGTFASSPRIEAFSHVPDAPYRVLLLQYIEGPLTHGAAPPTRLLYHIDAPSPAEVLDEIMQYTTPSRRCLAFVLEAIISGYSPPRAASRGSSPSLGEERRLHGKAYMHSEATAARAALRRVAHALREYYPLLYYHDTIAPLFLHAFLVEGMGENAVEMLKELSPTHRSRVLSIPEVWNALIKGAAAASSTTAHPLSDPDLLFMLLSPLRWEEDEETHQGKHTTAGTEASSMKGDGSPAIPRGNRGVSLPPVFPSYCQVVWHVGKDHLHGKPLPLFASLLERFGFSSSSSRMSSKDEDGEVMLVEGSREAMEGTATTGSTTTSSTEVGEETLACTTAAKPCSSVRRASFHVCRLSSGQWRYELEHVPSARRTVSMASLPLFSSLSHVLLLLRVSPVYHATPLLPLSPDPSPSRMGSFKTTTSSVELLELAIAMQQRCQSHAVLYGLTVTTATPLLLRAGSGFGGSASPPTAQAIVQRYVDTYAAQQAIFRAVEAQVLAEYKAIHDFCHHYYGYYEEEKKEGEGRRGRTHPVLTSLFATPTRSFPFLPALPPAATSQCCPSPCWLSATTGAATREQPGLHWKVCEEVHFATPSRMQDTCLQGAALWWSPFSGPCMQWLFLSSSSLSLLHDSLHKRRGKDVKRLLPMTGTTTTTMRAAPASSFLSSFWNPQEPSLFFSEGATPSSLLRLMTLPHPSPFFLFIRILRGAREVLVRDRQTAFSSSLLSPVQERSPSSSTPDTDVASQGLQGEKSHEQGSRLASTAPRARSGVDGSKKAEEDGADEEEVQGALRHEKWATMALDHLSDPVLFHSLLYASVVNVVKWEVAWRAFQALNRENPWWLHPSYHTALWVTTTPLGRQVTSTALKPQHDVHGRLFFVVRPSVPALPASGSEDSEPTRGELAVVSSSFFISPEESEEGARDVLDMLCRGADPWMALNIARAAVRYHLMDGLEATLWVLHRLDPSHHVEEAREVARQLFYWLLADAGIHLQPELHVHLLSLARVLIRLQLLSALRHLYNIFLDYHYLFAASVRRTFMEVMADLVCPECSSLLVTEEGEEATKEKKDMTEEERPRVQGAADHCTSHSGPTMTVAGAPSFSMSSLSPAAQVYFERRCRNCMAIVPAKDPVEGALPSFALSAEHVARIRARRRASIEAVRQRVHARARGISGVQGGKGAHAAEHFPEDTTVGQTAAALMSREARGRGIRSGSSLSFDAAARLQTCVLEKEGEDGHHGAALVAGVPGLASSLLEGETTTSTSSPWLLLPGVPRGFARALWPQGVAPPGALSTPLLPPSSQREEPQEGDVGTHSREGATPMWMPCHSMEPEDIREAMKESRKRLALHRALRGKAWALRGRAEDTTGSSLVPVWEREGDALAGLAGTGAVHSLPPLPLYHRTAVSSLPRPHIGREVALPIERIQGPWVCAWCRASHAKEASRTQCHDCGAETGPQAAWRRRVGAGDTMQAIRWCLRHAMTPSPYAASPQHHPLQEAIVACYVLMVYRRTFLLRAMAPHDYQLVYGLLESLIVHQEKVLAGYIFTRFIFPRDRLVPSVRRLWYALADLFHTQELLEAVDEEDEEEMGTAWEAWEERTMDGSRGPPSKGREAIALPATSKTIAYRAVLERLSDAEILDDDVFLPLVLTPKTCTLCFGTHPLPSCPILTRKFHTADGSSVPSPKGEGQAVGMGPAGKEEAAEEKTATARTEPLCMGETKKMKLAFQQLRHRILLADMSMKEAAAAKREADEDGAVEPTSPDVVGYPRDTTAEKTTTGTGVSAKERSSTQTAASSQPLHAEHLPKITPSMTAAVRAAYTSFITSPFRQLFAIHHPRWTNQLSLLLCRLREHRRGSFVLCHIPLPCRDHQVYQLLLPYYQVEEEEQVVQRILLPRPPPPPPLSRVASSFSPAAVSSAWWSQFSRWMDYPHPNFMQVTKTCCMCLEDRHASYACPRLLQWKEDVRSLRRHTSWSGPRRREGHGSEDTPSSSLTPPLAHRSQLLAQVAGWVDAGPERLTSFYRFLLDELTTHKGAMLRRHTGSEMDVTTPPSERHYPSGVSSSSPSIREGTSTKRSGRNLRDEEEKEEAVGWGANKNHHAPMRRRGEGSGNLVDAEDAFVVAIQRTILALLRIATPMPALTSVSSVYLSSSPSRQREALMYATSLFAHAPPSLLGADIILAMLTLGNAKYSMKTAKRLLHFEDGEEATRKEDEEEAPDGDAAMLLLHRPLSSALPPPGGVSSFSFKGSRSTSMAHLTAAAAAAVPLSQHCLFCFQPFSDIRGSATSTGAPVPPHTFMECRTYWKHATVVQRIQRLCEGVGQITVSFPEGPRSAATAIFWMYQQGLFHARWLRQDKEAQAVLARPLWELAVRCFAGRELTAGVRLLRLLPLEVVPPEVVYPPFWKAAGLPMEEVEERTLNLVALYDAEKVKIPGTPTAASSSSSLSSFFYSQWKALVFDGLCPHCFDSSHQSLLPACSVFHEELHFGRDLVAAYRMSMITDELDSHWQDGYLLLLVQFIATHRLSLPYHITGVCNALHAIIAMLCFRGESGIAAQVLLWIPPAYRRPQGFRHVLHSLQVPPREVTRVLSRLQFSPSSSSSSLLLPGAPVSQRRRVEENASRTSDEEGVGGEEERQRTRSSSARHRSASTGGAGATSSPLLSPKLPFRDEAMRVVFESLPVAHMALSQCGDRIYALARAATASLSLHAKEHQRTAASSSSASASSLVSFLASIAGPPPSEVSHEGSPHREVHAARHPLPPLRETPARMGEEPCHAVTPPSQATIPLTSVSLRPLPSCFSCGQQVGGIAQLRQDFHPVLSILEDALGMKLGSRHAVFQSALEVLSSSTPSPGGSEGFTSSSMTHRSGPSTPHSTGVTKEGYEPVPSWTPRHEGGRGGRKKRE